MTTEFFNIRMHFNPPLMAVEYPRSQRILIVKCKHEVSKYEVIRDFHWTDFRDSTIVDVIERLRGYASFLGVTEITQDQQKSLLAQLDCLIKEQQCQTHSGSIQDTTALVKSKGKSVNSSTSLTSKKSKVKQTKGSS